MLKNKTELNITHHDLKKKGGKKDEKKNGGDLDLSVSGTHALSVVSLCGWRDGRLPEQNVTHIVWRRGPPGHKTSGTAPTNIAGTAGTRRRTDVPLGRAHKNDGGMAGSGVTVALRARCGCGSGGAPRSAGTPTRGGASGGAPLPGALVRPGQPRLS